jgi:hypothetical protein
MYELFKYYISPPGAMLAHRFGWATEFRFGIFDQDAAHQSNVWSSTRQYKTAAGAIWRSPAGAPENDDSKPF